MVVFHSPSWLSDLILNTSSQLFDLNVAQMLLHFNVFCILMFYLRAPYSSYGDGKEPRTRSRSPAYGREGREPRDGHEGRDSGRESRLSRHSRDHEYRYRSSESRDKDLRSDPREPGYRWHPTPNRKNAVTPLQLTPFSFFLDTAETSMTDTTEAGMMTIIGERTNPTGTSTESPGMDVGSPRVFTFSIHFIRRFKKKKKAFWHPFLNVRRSDSTRRAAA